MISVLNTIDLRDHSILDQILSYLLIIDKDKRPKYLVKNILASSGNTASAIKNNDK